MKYIKIITASVGILAIGSAAYLLQTPKPQRIEQVPYDPTVQTSSIITIPAPSASAVTAPTTSPVIQNTSITPTLAPDTSTAAPSTPTPPVIATVLPTITSHYLQYRNRTDGGLDAFCEFTLSDGSSKEVPVGHTSNINTKISVDCMEYQG